MEAGTLPLLTNTQRAKENANVSAGERPSSMADTDPPRTYPSELPVLPLRQTVVFPLTLAPLAINRPTSIDAVQRALAADRLMFLAIQHTDREEPEPGDIRAIGTIAAIRQMAKAPNGIIQIVVEGTARAKAEAVTKSQASWRTRYTPTCVSRVIPCTLRRSRRDP